MSILQLPRPQCEKLTVGFTEYEQTQQQLTIQIVKEQGSKPTATLLKTMHIRVAVFKVIKLKMTGKTKINYLPLARTTRHPSVFP